MTTEIQELTGRHGTVKYVLVDSYTETILDIFPTIEQAKDALLNGVYTECLNNKREKNYLNYVWRTRESEKLHIKDMSRDHVRNALDWCVRHQTGPSHRKDNIQYSRWIAFFTMRLFDPNLA